MIYMIQLLLKRQLVAASGALYDSFDMHNVCETELYNC